MNRPPRQVREIGNPNQPLSNYVPVRATTPEMGPGWLSPKPPQRRISANPFSQIPRFSSPKPFARPPPADSAALDAEFLRNSTSSLHFSRREPRSTSKKSFKKNQ